MKKFITLVTTFLLLPCLGSCSAKEIRPNLTPESVAEAFADTEYSTFCHDISDEDHIPFRRELKVYHSCNESRDYILIYFFDDGQAAKDFQKENQSKAGMVWFFSLLFGESTMVHYDRYDYMVVESYKNKSAPSRDEMIKILESVIYS